MTGSETTVNLYAGANIGEQARAEGRRNEIRILQHWKAVVTAISLKSTGTFKFEDVHLAGVGTLITDDDRPERRIIPNIPCHFR
jgi:hypothetical protein